MEHSFFSWETAIIVVVSMALSVIGGAYADHAKQVHGSVWGRAFGIADPARPAWASRWWAKALFFPYPLLDFAMPLIAFSPFILLLLCMLALCSPFMLYDSWKERRGRAAASS